MMRISGSHHRCQRELLLSESWRSESLRLGQGGAFIFTFISASVICLLPPLECDPFIFRLAEEPPSPHPKLFMLHCERGWIVSRMP